jgi:acyl carrier protein
MNEFEIHQGGQIMVGVIETGVSPSVPSLNATESAIATLWREILQIAELPNATDDFFALGGDSMTMTMVEFRIKEELSVDLPPGAILSAPSLRELSALVEKERGAGAA